MTYDFDMHIQVSLDDVPLAELVRYIAQDTVRWSSCLIERQRFLERESMRAQDATAKQEWVKAKADGLIREPGLA
ncbi:MAG: hypothetical protein V4636_13105 [Pseudomonadota bacterium]